MKKSLTVLAGVLSLLAVGSLAQAETRFAVQGPAGATTPTDKMVVTDVGFIGVGTDAPLNAIIAKGNSYTTTQIISHYTGADPNGAGGFLAKKNNVSTTNGGLPVLGDRIGYMLFGSIGTDSQDKNAAGFGAYAESTWTNGSFPAYFAIETAAPSSARAEKMRVAGNGNVGIGSKSPKTKLEVNGGVRVYPVTANANTETPTNDVRPECNATTRGTIWFQPSAPADILEVCVKISNDYAFRAVTFVP